MKNRQLKNQSRPTKEYAGIIPPKRIEYYRIEVATAALNHSRVKILENDMRKARLDKEIWIEFVVAILNEIPEGEELSEEEFRNFIKSQIEFPYGY